MGVRVMLREGQSMVGMCSTMSWLPTSQPHMGCCACRSKLMSCLQSGRRVGCGGAPGDAISPHFTPGTAMKPDLSH